MARAPADVELDRRTLAALRVLGLSADALRPASEEGDMAVVERVQLAYRQSLRLYHPDKLPTARARSADAETHVLQQAKPPQAREREEEDVPSVDRIRQARKHLIKALGHRSTGHPGDASGSEDGMSTTSDSDSDAGAAGAADARTAYTEVDLDDFDYLPAADAATLDGGCGGGGTYILACRCGRAHRVTDDDLDAGVELVECEGCSLVVRLLYEPA